VKRTVRILSAAILALCAAVLAGAAEERPRELRAHAWDDFHGGAAAAFTAEGTMNARSWGAFGGGLLLGCDINGTMLGLRAACSVNGAPMRVLENLLFFRLYLPSLRGREGFFAQLEAGPCLIFERGHVVGAVTAGLAAGWRFPLGRRWFVEPFVRAGYPFIAGAGVGTGMKW
jgi:hypothetical protein